MPRWILLLCLLVMPLSATAGSKGGTLIVTYQIGMEPAPACERIHRMRFWLINAKHEQHMYPKKGRLRETSEACVKTVVIEDLPPGVYTLEFLIPNQDNFFQPVPQREVVLEAGKTVKIHQRIQPH